MNRSGGTEPVILFEIFGCGLGEAALVSEVLWSRGVQGIEESDNEHGGIDLRSSFGVSRQETEEILHCLFENFSELSWKTIEMDSSVADTWKQFVRPIRVSPDTIIIPSWMSESQHREFLTRESIPRDRCIRIDPGNTFGMGDHPTTLGSLQMLVRWMKSGAEVLDIGCGSGILGITALVLGARQAHGIDINPASVPVSIENAFDNDVASHWSVSLEPLDVLGRQFDLITANILAPVLIDLADQMVSLLDDVGTLIISGVLRNGYAHVLRALEPLTVVEEIDIDGWVTCALRR